MQQEKAKESYKNKNGFICLWLAAKLRKQINPFFIYSPPSNKFLTQDCSVGFLTQDCSVGFLTQDCSVGAAETAAPPGDTLL